MVNEVVGARGSGLENHLFRVPSPESRAPTVYGSQPVAPVTRAAGPDCVYDPRR